MMDFTPRVDFIFSRQAPRPEMLEYESEKLLGRQGGDESTEFIDIERLRPQPRRFTTFLTWIWRLTICCLSLWAFVNISLNTWHFARRNNDSQSQATKVSCSCGNSVSDALSMGCKYDALASAWLPTACIDADLSYEFDHAGPEPDGSWVYYTDYDKTGTYTLEEVSLLADTGAYYYNTMAWHLAHCTYNWRKAVRSKWTGVTLEHRSDTEEHVDHCEMMFKDRTSLDYVGTVSIVTTNADWQEMHEEMHPMHPMHPEMHPENKMHPAMHPQNEMHPYMHHNDNMHPSSKMHPESHMHPDSNMHPEMHLNNDMHPTMHPESNMHPDMHSNSKMHPAMHPENDMHPSMHPDSEMHPSSKMHPSMHPGNEMHPEMHPTDVMHPDMHPNEKMHPDHSMHPSNNMHPDMHPAMHPENKMHPAMRPENKMHPAMHPDSEMHPSMHPGLAH